VIELFKVFAFLKRNTKLLSHDDYRAGHVGFHCCNSRRLKNIRGYLVNIWANVGLASKIGADYDKIIIDEPSGFLNLWDGFPEVYFDDASSWSRAATAEPNRATETGLSIDPDWTLADAPLLFDPVNSSLTEFKSNHLQMNETVVISVDRPERKITKIIQFFKKRPMSDDIEFRQMVSQNYVTKLAQIDGLKGLVLNFRDPDIDSAIRDFYPDTAWHFSEQGQTERFQFASLWDGVIEMYFDNIGGFKEGRIHSAINQELLSLEKNLFSSVWYVEVDENVIIIPNRNPAPAFYHR